MRLVGEVEEAARHAEALEDVEGLEALGDGDAVVAVAVDDELGRLEVAGVRQGIPALIVLPVVPDGAVRVVLDEPQLVRRVLRHLVDLAIVADERLELAP